MRRKHFKDDDETAVDMTPMLDIVFIMLIFFIVTTSFVKESGVVVDRPDPNQSNDQPKTKKNQQFVGPKMDHKKKHKSLQDQQANPAGAILKALVSKMAQRWLRMAPSSPR